MEHEIANPRPSDTIKSLGYGLEAAVADLVDNSIAAKAQQVDAVFTWDERLSCVVTIDGGEGMTQTELVAAMTIAARGPGTLRTSQNLGRFGRKRIAGFLLVPDLRYIANEEALQTAGPRTWLEQQGLYVYRQERLMIARDWLGIRGFRESATAVLTHRRRVTTHEHGTDFVRAWTVSRRNGQVICCLNRKHPPVRQALRAGTDEPAATAALIRLLEESVPIAGLRVMHQAETIDGPEAYTSTADEEAEEVAERIQTALVVRGCTLQDRRRAIRLMPLFDQLAGFWHRSGVQLVRDVCTCA